MKSKRWLNVYADGFTGLACTSREEADTWAKTVHPMNKDGSVSLDTKRRLAVITVEIEINGGFVKVVAVENL